MWTQAAASGAAACLVGGAAWSAGWLTLDGAVAAAAVGTAVFTFGGWGAALALIAFFVTSTLLGRLPGRSRHGARDWRQVVANGGVAAIAAVASGVPAWSHVARMAFGAALAAATADTWATEVGTRFGGRPRALLVGRPVQRGASGGMTAAGTAAGCVGAAVLACVWRLAAGGAGVALYLPGRVAPLLAVTAGGTAGLLLDSATGAALQGTFRCTQCGLRIEEPRHAACPNAAATLVRGWPWLDNDAVNLVATTAAALVGALMGAL